MDPVRAKTVVKMEVGTRWEKGRAPGEDDGAAGTTGLGKGEGEVSTGLAEGGSLRVVLRRRRGAPPGGGGGAWGSRSPLSTLLSSPSAWATVLEG